MLFFEEFNCKGFFIKNEMISFILNDFVSNGVLLLILGFCWFDWLLCIFSGCDVVLVSSYFISSLIKVLEPSGMLLEYSKTLL